jgi:hypothetical protein
MAIRDAKVLVYQPNNTTAYDEAISLPDGQFTINLPDTNEYMIYIPMKRDYIGYSLSTNNIGFISLFMRQQPNEFAYSGGTDRLNLLNSVLYTGQIVTDVKASPTHIYITTCGGLDILDKNTYENVGYALYSGGFSCLSLNENYVTKSNIYLGTTTSGVLSFLIPSGYDSSNKNVSNLLIEKWTLSNNNILSNKVTCIDQNSSNIYLVGTNSGVDYYNGNIRYSHQYDLELDTKCCSISNYNDVYYSPTNSGLYVKYTPTSNWSNPDYKVVLSGTGLNPFPLLTNYINDIDIKSISGSNSVFLATNSGIIYYNENRADLNITASGSKLISKYPIN